MSRKNVDNSELERWRSLPAIHVLAQISDHVKVDPTFRPLRNAASVRVHVSVSARDFELVCTREKWWDTRAERGGGGAIDLVMHLKACSFKEAAVILHGAQL